MRVGSGWVRVACGVVVMVIAGAGISACGSGHHAAPKLTVTPARALYDTPIGALVTGLTSGEQVELRMTSKDRSGVTWAASADFRADVNGRVSTAQSPVSGSYTGANPMGLIEAMTPGKVNQYFGPPAKWTLTTVVIVNGHQRAAATVTRLQPAQTGVTETLEKLPSSGVYGHLYRPAHATTASAKPGIVMFGGSEGGLDPSIDDQSALLAAHGYPTLALAYFHEPGLPGTLSRVPLEYFAHAARLLARQPGVDPKRIVLWGLSRGSEAALLTAADYPSLIHGVIGSVPAAEANPAFPGDFGPAWTLHGKALSTATQGEGLAPSARSPAAIPVERINGPLFLDCAGQDEEWNSCRNVAVLRERLTAHGSHRVPTVLTYPQAGHLVGALRPYRPNTGVVNGVDAGAKPFANNAAAANGWPKLLTFLGRLGD